MKIVTRKTWGAVAAKSRIPFRGDVNGFIVHHTTGEHVGRSDSAAWLRSIQRYHFGLGWSDIAYHFVVDQNGSVFEGRGWDVQGAHAAHKNGDTIGVAFLGNGDRVTDAAIESIANLYDEACDYYGSDLILQGHRDVGRTHCPGTRLYAWVKQDLPVRSGTPIVTFSDTVDVGTAKQWARNNNAADLFVNEIIPSLYGAAARMRTINGGEAPDAAMVVAQSAKETGWGRFGGVLDPSFRNTAGIKTAKGGGNFDPDAHQRFGSWAEGARAHLNHLAAYTGLRPVGVPHGRYNTVNSLLWAGSIVTVEQLGSRWAPNPAYGKDIVRMLSELATTKLPVLPPPAPVVETPKPVADPVLRLGSKGEHVRKVQSWLTCDGSFGVRTYESVRKFQREHGMVPDGIVGPLTWAKLREVYE